MAGIKGSSIAGATLAVFLLAACDEGRTGGPTGDAARSRSDAGASALGIDASVRVDGSSGAEGGQDVPETDGGLSATADAGRLAMADAGLVACAGGDRPSAVDVTGVSVRAADGGVLGKGAELAVELTVDVSATCVASATLMVRITSERFSDYENVPLGEVSIDLRPGIQTVRVTGGPFLSDLERNKHYALGSGRYRVSEVELDLGGNAVNRDSEFDGAAFELASNSVLLIPVVYDQGYFDGIRGLTTSTPEEYMTQVVTRPGALFTPTTSDPDGPGTYQRFEGGFDEMMGVHHLFHAFAGFPGENTTTDGWCEDATAYGERVLGMAARWESRPDGTQPERHGFDYLIALTPDMGGGVACGWIDVQVSSFINRDLDRQQVVSVHESGHLFGAPHCNDVGNGSGGDLLGYVMCSGEIHERYPGEFVWHQTSRDRMRNKWN